MADGARDFTQVSATGDVTTSAGRLRSVVLTAGSDAATLVVRSDGSGGAARLTLKAAASTSFVWRAGSDGVPFTTLHATLTGTGPVAAFEYS